jgi:hypothetical protein
LPVAFFTALGAFAIAVGNTGGAPVRVTAPRFFACSLAFFTNEAIALSPQIRMNTATPTIFPTLSESSARMEGNAIMAADCKFQNSGWRFLVRLLRMGIYSMFRV